MARQASITELATQISENLAKVENYLRSNNLPQPSFLPDGPTNLIMSVMDVEDSRLAAVEAAAELLDLLQGPVACLLPPMNPTSLEAVYRWNIPKHVPIDGVISFSDLARNVGLGETNLRRIVRYAIVYHRIFREPRLGYIAHSAASRLLADDKSLSSAVGVVTEEFVPAYTRTCDALQSGSEERNRTGYALAHCPNQTYWEYYETHPARGKRFADSLNAFAAFTGQSLSSLVSDYPWSLLPEGSTVVDVGGSKGHVSFAIADAHPHLEFIVQDLPEVVAEVQEEQRASKNILDKKVEFMAHDFLTPQPKEADVFLFRWIFHDWPDKYVIKILRNLVPVLKPGTRIVVNDGVMPAPGSVPLEIERKTRFLDLLMLTVHNAGEREEGDWRKLFQEADNRLQNINIWTPPGSGLSIIEATWVP